MLFNWRLVWLGFSVLATLVSCVVYQKTEQLTHTRANNDVDVDYPGYQFRPWTGMGNWYFGDVRVWSLVFICTMCTLGVFASSFQLLAAQVLGSGAVVPSESNPDSVTVDVPTAKAVGGSILNAFFSAAAVEEGYKYMIVCTARAIRRNKKWNEEVLILSLWGVVAFATVENLMYVGGAQTLKSALVTAGLRAAMSVPSHCFWGLITCLGVMQCYTVKRSKTKAMLILLAHYLLAVFLHGLFDFVLFMVQYEPNMEIATYVIVIAIACCANPVGCCLLYKKWKSDNANHHHDAPAYPVESLL